MQSSSLRTRRPSIAPSSLLRNKSKSTADPSDAKPSNRKSKAVSDKIKRRLSLRYASSPPPPVPSLPTNRPSAPQGAIARRRPSILDSAGLWGARDELDVPASVLKEEDELVGGSLDLVGGGGMRKDPGTLDISLINQEGFDPQAYIKTKLAGASPEDIGAFAAALEANKAATAKDLQRNVFKNYAEFITISKEIATLENDMLELKELLSEWKGVPEALGNIEDPESQARKPSQTPLVALSNSTSNRSSVADLQTLYRQQLHNLYTTVSGSQKFIPIIPGRHIVAEANSFIELNPATYKVKGPVQLFVLSDLVLIAGIKKRRIGGGGMGDGADKGGKGKGKEGGEDGREGRLVAEKCWILAEVTVVDVKDSGDLTNAIKIRRGKETLIFRTNQPEEKRALLASFRQVAETLATKKRKEIEKEQVRRKSLWQGDMAVPLDSSAPALPSSFSNLSISSLPGSRTSVLDLGRRSTSTDAPGADMKWVDDFGDELAVAIALQDWEEAVRLVEKGRAHLFTFSSSADPVPSLILRQKFLPLQNALFTSLTHELAQPNLRKSTLATLVSYFYRLDQPELARSTFLSARTDLIKRRIGQIKWEGDNVVYVNELAVVCFMGVKNTTEWYLNAFREHGMASALVKWAKEQVEAFGSMFQQQIFSDNLDQAVIDQVLELVRHQSKKLLHDIGLDLTFLLRSILVDRRTTPTTIERRPTPPSIRPRSIVPVSSTTELAGEPPVGGSRLRTVEPA